MLTDTDVKNAKVIHQVIYRETCYSDGVHSFMTAAMMLVAGVTATFC